MRVPLCVRVAAVRGCPLLCVHTPGGCQASSGSPWGQQLLRQPLRQAPDPGAPSPPGRWDGLWHQSAQLCGSQGWVIDGLAQPPLSPERPHPFVIHMGWGGRRAGRRGRFCTHHPVQAGSAVPQGAPGPLLAQPLPPDPHPVSATNQLVSLCLPAQPVTPCRAPSLWTSGPLQPY